jgi:hypothetical protein
MNTDPLAPLWDKTIRNGLPVLALEQPTLDCVCDDGWISNDWLHCIHPREVNCTCSSMTNDFTNVLHDVSCDSVPCPLCPLETP